jgi:hypothetical protein
VVMIKKKKKKMMMMIIIIKSKIFRTILKSRTSIYFSHFKSNRATNKFSTDKNLTFDINSLSPKGKHKKTSTLTKRLDPPINKSTFAVAQLVEAPR